MIYKVLTKDEWLSHNEEVADIMPPSWEPTCKLRWFNPFPYDRCKLQQEWVNQYGEAEWRDVPTE